MTFAFDGRKRKRSESVYFSGGGVIVGHTFVPE